MSEDARFTVKFDGDVVEAGMMPVPELAPALLGLAEVVEATNRIVTGGEHAIVLHVRPRMRRGSFSVDLEIAQTMARKFVDLFSGNEARAIAAFLTIIGLRGGYGLIQLIKRSKGKPARSVIAIENTSRMTVTFDGEPPIEVERQAMDLFNSTAARNGMAQFTAPLRRQTVDSVTLRNPGADPVVISADEAEAFEAPSPSDQCLVTESERVLQIISPSFKQGNKWRVSEGASTYYVSILDEEFWARVARGDVGFHASDFLRVVLRTKQSYDGAGLTVAYDVVKILKHIHGPGEPPELQFGGGQPGPAPGPGQDDP